MCREAQFSDIKMPSLRIWGPNRGLVNAEYGIDPPPNPRVRGAECSHNEVGLISYEGKLGPNPLVCVVRHHCYTRKQPRIGHVNCSLLTVNS